MKTLFRPGTALVLFAAVGFSLKSLLVKLLYQKGVDPVSLLVLRSFPATFLFLAALYATEGGNGFRVPADLIWPVLRVSTFGMLASMIFSYLALARLDASLATVVFHIYPVLATLLLLVQGNTVRKSAWFTIGIIFAGLVLVLKPFTGTWKLDPVGIVLALLSALAFAYYNVGSIQLMRGISGLKIMTVCVVQIQLVALFFLPQVNLPVHADSWGFLILLAVFPGFLAMVAFMRGLKLLGALPTVVLTTLSPVLSLFLAVLILGEHPGWSGFSGSLLVVGGILVMKISGAEKPETEEPPTGESSRKGFTFSPALIRRTRVADSAD